MCSVESRGAKKLGRADNLHPQQTPVCIEVENDVTSSWTPNDDVLDGSPLGDGFDLEVSSVRFVVVSKSHEAFDHVSRVTRPHLRTDLPPSVRSGSPGRRGR